MSVIILVAFFLRAETIFWRAPWFDEAFSWRVIQFPWREMIERGAQDVHSPLYLLLLKAWAAVFGASMASLRMPSVIFGTATVVAVYFLVRTVLGDSHHSRLAGLTASALAAVLPAHVFWGGQARMYTLAVFLGVMATRSIIRALQAPASVWRWAIYGGWALTFLYSHYVAAFTLLVHGIAALVSIFHGANRRWNEHSRKGVQGAALSLAIVVIGFAPWLPTFAAQQQRVAQDWWVKPIDGLQALAFWLRMFVPVQVTSTSLLAVGALATMGGLSLLVIRPRGAERSIVAFALLPFALMVAATNWLTPFMTDRSVLLSHLFVAVATALLVTRVPRTLLAALVAVVLIGGNAFVTLQLRTRLVGSPKPDAEAAAIFLEQQRTPADRVVACPLEYFSLRYYGAHADDWWIYAGPDGQPKHWRGGPLFASNETVVGLRELTEFGPGRVFVIDTTGHGGRCVDIPRNWRLVHVAEFPKAVPKGAVVVAQFLVEPGNQPRQ